MLLKSRLGVVCGVFAWIALGFDQQASERTRFEDVRLLGPGDAMIGCRLLRGCVEGGLLINSATSPVVAVGWISVVQSTGAGAGFGRLRSCSSTLRPGS
ncbi:exported hypothetical protein [Thiocapsa sp. KS1]|jgi:hypothetical protein|nr:exported hypothetical protein [Thiocapsa sp. KS1]